MVYSLGENLKTESFNLLSAPALDVCVWITGAV